MSELHSYCKPLNLGHKGLEEMWDENFTYVCQEKVDGSQFSFGVDEDGVLHCRSRQVAIDLDAPGMFGLAVQTAKRLAPDLHPLWTYRGEFLAKPKHNALAYDRVPLGNIILFDIDQGAEDYLYPDDLLTEADRLGLEHVPTWTHEGIPEYSMVKAWAGEVSCLGGVQREGVVIKAYGRYDPHTYKTFMAKYVREEFKEQNSENWKKMNPGRKDVVIQIIENLKTEARWRKAIQHLRERGEIKGEPADIGPLLKEINQDTKEEQEKAIKDLLFDAMWKDISRGITAGFPEFYKERLAEGLDAYLKDE